LLGRPAEREGGLRRCLKAEATGKVQIAFGCRTLIID
jgi:hypothetical protein